MTSVLERVDVEAINRQAAEARLGLTILTIIAAVFFGIGWITRKFCLSVAWSAIAVREGWRQAGQTGVISGSSRSG